MGLKEEIDKLTSQRRAFLTQQQADLEAMERVLAEEEIKRQRDESREDAIREANYRLSDEIGIVIFSPQLTETAEQLNNNLQSKDKPWNLIPLEGDTNYSEGITDGWDGISRYDHFRVNYKGHGLIREQSRYGTLEKISFLGIGFSVPFDRIYFDLIFVGRVNDTAGVVHHMHAQNTSGFGKRVSNGGIVFEIDKLHNAESKITIPKTSPERLAEDIAQVRNGNSDLGKNVREGFDNAIIRVISQLPEFIQK